jgi:hypothetical protein
MQPDSNTCYPFCPTGWNIDDTTCTLAHNLAFHTEFVEVDINIRNLAQTSLTFTTNAKPTPVNDRGHYFNGSTYWQVDGTNAFFYFHHDFTIATWIKIPNVTTTR